MMPNQPHKAAAKRSPGLGTERGLHLLFLASSLLVGLSRWPVLNSGGPTHPKGTAGHRLGWTEMPSDGVASLLCGAQPHPRPLQRGHLGCRDVFGITQHILMVLGCSPARWGSPAALHVPSPAERCIAMTTLLKNSARRLLWGFLLRAHLQTLLACQLLRLGLPGNPKPWQWGRAENGAESIPLKALRVPDAPPPAPHAPFSPLKNTSLPQTTSASPHFPPRAPPRSLPWGCPQPLRTRCCFPKHLCKL